MCCVFGWVQVVRAATEVQRRLSSPVHARLTNVELDNTGSGGSLLSFLSDVNLTGTLEVVLASHIGEDCFCELLVGLVLQFVLGQELGVPLEPLQEVLAVAVQSTLRHPCLRMVVGPMVGAALGEPRFAGLLFV